MPKIQIVCPKCEKINLVDPHDPKSKCEQCGASLNIEAEVKENTLIKKEKKIVSSLKLAEKYTKDEEWAKLNKLTEKLFEESPDAFSSYAYGCIAMAKFNFFKSYPPTPYRLNDDELEEDIKARIYHYARKKYNRCTEQTKEALDAYYPSYKDDENSASTKAHTCYDDLVFKLSISKAIVKNIQEDYFSHLSKLANTPIERAFVRNVETWIEEVKKAEGMLRLYDLEADAFVQKDYQSTPRPGNKPKFIVSLVMLSISIALFILSLVRLLFSVADMDSFYRVPALIVSGLETFSIASMIAFYMVKERKYVEKHKALFIVSSLVLIIVAIMDIVIIATLHNRIVNISFAVIGMSISLVVGFTAFYYFLFYKPNNTYKAGTYIGNFKALAKNNFEVVFPFNWDNIKKDETKKRKRIK